MRKSRTRRLGWAAGLALTLILASSSFSHAALNIKKPYTIDIQPPDLLNGSTNAVMTITVTNTTTTQNLGSCNISQAAFTLKSTTDPGTGSAQIVNNVLRLRDLATLPTTSRSVDVTVDAPTVDGLYTWSVECRQANNFSPDKPSNKFTLDIANSNRTTNVYTPLPNVDVAITSNSDNPDPVVGANTVEYTVRVHNNSGSLPSGSLTLTDSLPNGGAITSISTSGWSCPGTLPAASTQCTHAAIGPGANAQDVIVRVLAPNADTTITNRAHVDQTGANDPNSGNDTSNQNTTVQKDSSCATGFVSCGNGVVVYNLDSKVTAGDTPSLQRFLVGTTYFKATTTAGSESWNMEAPAVPGSNCPISFASGAPLTQCTWQMNLKAIPSVYTAPGKVTFEAICYVAKCPIGVVPGAGTIVVIIHDDNTQDLIGGCSGPGDTGLCFEQQRIAGGHLLVRVRNLIAGDPRIAGHCIGGGC